LQTTTQTYKLIKKIRDERFDEELIHQYHLLINIGTRDFQALIIDPADNRVILLEDYVLPAVSSHAELLQLLEQLFDAHAVLRAGFWKKIKVAFKNQKFVQVPKALFAEEALSEYLKFNAPIDDELEDFLSVENPRAEAITIYAVNKDIKTWLLRIYPNNPPIFLHQSSALIEGILKFAENRKDNPLYIYVDRFKLHILSCTNGSLVYYNQFAIKQFSDYLKYIMLVMKSLNLDQHTSKVLLWGYIGKNSPHYQEFYKYISNVVFGDRPNYLNFGYAFDEIQEHHFFDTYSIHLIN
jgi:hypothetical protein